jgi:hypothetical protein
MSYDLAVFDPVAAPLEKEAFIDWFHSITEWTEDRDYDDPRGTAPVLMAWFRAMIKQFPALNGPYASNSLDNEKAADYSIDESLIYIAFSWSVTESAYQATFSLAAKHGAGFFDVSGEGGIWFPDSCGKLKRAFEGFPI